MSVFGESIGFLAKLGIYDVVLPFLLVFTITFALLDKTKMLGTESGKVNGEMRELTKKNLNAMVAFVIAFFVVASSQLVAVINKTMSQMFLLVLLVVSFLMLAGAFHKQEKDGFFLDPKKDGHKFYYSAFMVIGFVVILAIFLNALGWLDWVYGFLKNNWNTSYVAAVILIVLIIGFMMYITKDPETGKKEEKSGS